MCVVNFHHYGSAAALTSAFGDKWLYVGRRNLGFALAQSPLANPFVNDRRKNGTVVSDPIGEYRRWLWARIKQGDQGVMGELAKITPDTPLVCWCAPAPCHAEVIEKAAAWLRSTREKLPEKALSIQQPWPWLIVNGYKDIENRDWRTAFRGRFLVHAGKKIDKAGYAYVVENFPDITLPEPSALEVGGVVGMTMLMDCVSTSPSRWFMGKWGFVLSESKALPFAAARGQLGFFPCRYEVNR